MNSSALSVQKLDTSAGVSVRPERAFGQLGGILALVFGRAAAEAQRLIGAVGRGLLPM